MPGNVIPVSSENDWEAKHTQARGEGKVVVVDFTATWCGPCKAAAPKYEELSMQYPKGLFLKVDVDELQTIAQRCNVRAMPTFQVWMNGSQVGEVVGADMAGLRSLLDTHVPTFSAFTGQGRTLAAAPTPSAAPTAAQAPPSSDWKGVDESRPITTIQLRLPDGSRLQGRFNTSHTVADVRSYLQATRADVPQTLALMSSFPPRPLKDFDRSIEELGLQNAALMVKY